MILGFVSITMSCSRLRVAATGTADVDIRLLPAARIEPELRERFEAR
jgi:hypothetical protein